MFVLVCLVSLGILHTPWKKCKSKRSPNSRWLIFNRILPRFVLVRVLRQLHPGHCIVRDKHWGRGTSAVKQCLSGALEVGHSCFQPMFDTVWQQDFVKKIKNPPQQALGKENQAQRCLVGHCKMLLSPYIFTQPPMQRVRIALYTNHSGKGGEGGSKFHFSQSPVVEEQPLLVHVGIGGWGGSQENNVNGGCQPAKYRLHPQQWTYSSLAALLFFPCCIIIPPCCIVIILK